MEINFAKSDIDTTQTTNAAQLPAVRENLPVAKREGMLADVVVPRCHLVHSVGILKDSFQPGSYVYAQSTTLYTPPVINAKAQTIEKPGSPPLNVTFLDIRPKRYFEKVEGGGRGLILDTLEEVAAEGGTTNWKEFELKKKDGIKKFDEAQDCLLAIERPEMVADDDTIFVFDIGGRKYALAMYNFKGSAGFTPLKSTVLTHKLIGCLRDGISKHSYAFSSTLKPTPNGKNTYWCSVLVAQKANSPELLEFAKKVMNAPVVEAPEVDSE